MNTTTHIPTLTTERLTLRPPVLDDFEAFADMVTGPRGKFMEEGLTRKDAWGWFCSDIAHWHLFGFGSLMIQAEGETVGEVGISNGEGFHEPELGWLLYDGRQGHGYAAEAAEALRNYAYEECGLTTLVSYIDPRNARSIALAERLGATRDNEAARPAPEDLVYRHPGPEALQ